MQKINLNMNLIATTIYRTIVVALLMVIVILNLNVLDKQTVTTNVLVSHIDNVYEKLDGISDQPEIPDANNNEYQASCPVEPNYYDDPEKVARFIEIVGPYGQQYPWMIDYLISSNILKSEQIRKMLQDEYSSIQTK